MYLPADSMKPISLTYSDSLFLVASTQSHTIGTTANTGLPIGRSNNITYLNVPLYAPYRAAWMLLKMQCVHIFTAWYLVQVYARKSTGLLLRIPFPIQSSQLDPYLVTFVSHYHHYAHFFTFIALCFILGYSLLFFCDLFFFRSLISLASS